MNITNNKLVIISFTTKYCAIKNIIGIIISKDNIYWFFSNFFIDFIINTTKRIPIIDM